MRVFVFLIFLTIQIFSIRLVIAAESIGRLFTTPVERSNLDYIRQTTNNIPLKAEVATPDTPKEHAAISMPDAVIVQGYVKRNDGKQGTVWVNNNALQENSGNRDVEVGKLSTSGNRVPLKLSNGKRLTLKAGQVYDPESNRVHEARSHGAQGDADVGRIGDEAPE